MSSSSRIYKNALELLHLYNSSPGFKTKFQRLLERPNVYYKGIKLKEYVKTLTQTSPKFIFYRFRKLKPEVVDDLFTNFYRDTFSRQRLEKSASQYQLDDLDRLQDQEKSLIETLPEGKEKENAWQKFLDEHTKEQSPNKKIRQPALEKYKDLVQKTRSEKLTSTLKDISSKGQILARKGLSKLTTTQLWSGILGTTGAILGAASGGGTGALIGGSAGLVTPYLINHGYGEKLLKVGYKGAITTSNVLNGIGNLKIGLPGKGLLKGVLFKNPIVLIIAVVAGIILALIPGGILESSALLPPYTPTAGSTAVTPAVTPPASGTLTLTKSGPNEVAAGDDINYEISLNYSGNTPVNIEVTDTIPPQTDFKSASDGGSNSSGTVKWVLTSIAPGTTKKVTLVTTTKPGVNEYIQNTAEAKIVSNLSGSNGGTSIGPLPGTPATPITNWSQLKSEVLTKINNTNNVAIYKQASAITGIAWEVLAGIHYIEGSANPNSSLVSGRAIGSDEPDVRRSGGGCSSQNQGPGIPIALSGGGCGFASLLDSAIYAGYHLNSKVGGKAPQGFEETVAALAGYNGWGNTNCGKTPYNNCPPQFPGDDHLYPMSKFDSKHDPMYIVYCQDLKTCQELGRPPVLYSKLGVMAIVRALIEN